MRTYVGNHSNDFRHAKKIPLAYIVGKERASFAWNIASKKPVDGISASART
jgi:hypothetical protein